MMGRACQPCCHPLTNMSSIDINALRPWGGVGKWRDVRGRVRVGSKGHRRSCNVAHAGHPIPDWA